MDTTFTERKVSESLAIQVKNLLIQYKTQENHKYKKLEAKNLPT